jgi:hypothetical protein
MQDLRLRLDPILPHLPQKLHRLRRFSRDDLRREEGEERLKVPRDVAGGHGCEEKVNEGTEDVVGGCGGAGGDDAFGGEGGEEAAEGAGRGEADGGRVFASRRSDGGRSVGDPVDEFPEADVVPNFEEVLQTPRDKESTFAFSELGELGSEELRGDVRDVRRVGDHRREGEVQPSRAGRWFRPLRLSTLEQSETGEGVDRVVLGEDVDPQREMRGRDLAGLEEAVEEVSRDGVAGGEGAGDPASAALEEETVVLVGDGREVGFGLVGRAFASWRS